MGIKTPMAPTDIDVFSQRTKFLSAKRERCILVQSFFLISIFFFTVSMQMGPRVIIVCGGGCPRGFFLGVTFVFVFSGLVVFFRGAPLRCVCRNCKEFLEELREKSD
jgi:hypothetical protein